MDVLFANDVLKASLPLKWSLLNCIPKLFLNDLNCLERQQQQECAKIDLIIKLYFYRCIIIKL